MFFISGATIVQLPLYEHQHFRTQLQQVQLIHRYNWNKFRKEKNKTKKLRNKVAKDILTYLISFDQMFQLKKGVIT